MKSENNTPLQNNFRVIKKAVGIDLGGTFIKSGVVDEKGEIIKKLIFVLKGWIKKKLKELELELQELLIMKELFMKHLIYLTGLIYL